MTPAERLKEAIAEERRMSSRAAYLDGANGTREAASDAIAAVDALVSEIASNEASDALRAKLTAPDPGFKEILTRTDVEMIVSACVNRFSRAAVSAYPSYPMELLGTVAAKHAARLAAEAAV